MYSSLNIFVQSPRTRLKGVFQTEDDKKTLLRLYINSPNAGFQTPCTVFLTMNSCVRHCHKSKKNKPLKSAIFTDHDDLTEDNIVFTQREERYTVEDAVEHMGFGWFQMKIFFICGMFAVRYYITNIAIF